MDDIRIRMATLEDASEINEIYREYILNTAITFEYDPVTDEAFQERIEKTLTKLPYLVCEINSKIVGYAYASPFRTRAAYNWDLESTVYIHKDYYRRNIATALYDALLNIIKRLGYVNLFAVITDPNEKSKKFHESMGFVQVGLYPEAGYKLGRWWGINTMCKRINEAVIAPPPVQSVHAISKELLEEIFTTASNKVVKK